ncbi:DUF6596 domain-containing protein [Phenylobacterium terrae]|uniref:DUF6596 domain-containing protein n=1 Tax=Phenylobacterium terrae TaxID=2665495 RepID=A0ABW4N214_9CAUL
MAALVRFAEARRPARLDAAGAMVPPDRQEVGLWRADLIHEGVRLLDRAAEMGRSGPRQLLAAVHASHCARIEGRPTPWPDIAALYEILMLVRPHAATAVNRAVAIGEARGAEEGLAALAAITGVEGWLPYQAARAGLCVKAGRRAEAACALKSALALSPAPAERLWLERQLRNLDEGSASG